MIFIIIFLLTVTIFYGLRNFNLSNANNINCSTDKDCKNFYNIKFSCINKQCVPGPTLKYPPCNTSHARLLLLPDDKLVIDVFTCKCIHPERFYGLSCDKPSGLVCLNGILGNAAIGLWEACKCDANR